ncbi:MAG: hypothetical protein KF689_12525 [Gemmatimonadaceae bacterium]|nr:hypothetical protein [Gemmatimonadaceae bacterium]MCW5827193.1 hypothetical protein [Gemmatimonadaceae bacterium]
MRVSSLRAFIFVGTLAVAFALPAAAQAPRPARALAAPTAELEEPWSGPLQLVELRDGNILVHDSRDKRVAVADFRTQEQREVAREGGGPTEYRSVMGMWLMPGDSVQALDLFQQRVLVFDPSGTPRATRPLPGAGDPMQMMNRPMTRALDARGRWYGQQMAVAFEGGQMQMADSALIVRTDPATMRADTLTKFPTFMTAPQMSPQVVRMPVPGYPPIDAWGVFPDGRVMVVRGRGYVPEIFPVGGAPRRAAALSYAQLPVTAEDRRAIMDSVRKAIDDGIRQFAGMGGGAQMPRIELVEPSPWQTQRPPITGDLIRVDPKGRAWVPVVDRTPGQRYDLLDADGRVVDAIKLQRDVQLLGFGAQAVYTARKDEDDLLYIRRHPLP